MRVAKYWKDYELIDVSCGERLERWGKIVLVRPDPQVIWKTKKFNKLWQGCDAHYYRSKKGGGRWEKYKTLRDNWTVSYKRLRFKVGFLGFKHTGVFPEQSVNWDFCSDIISKSSKQMSVLNLFAYTGGATLACADAGARVCHVDSSKGMVSWAKENAKISNLSEKPIRWIVDDCTKFAQKEKRRGNRYDGIIMDPPSFGRGPGGEVWRLEDNLYEFIGLCESLLSDEAKFFILNSYTTGLSPSVMEYIMKEVIQKKRKGTVLSSEIGLEVKDSNLILPAGSTSIWVS